MRILLTSQYFWPEDFRINDLMEGLVSRGHEVVVLTGMPNYPKGVLMDGYSWRGPYSEMRNGIKVVRVPLVPRGHGRGVRLVMNYLSYVISACLLGPLRCRGRFDVVFVFQVSPVTVGIPARLLAWQKRAPLLFWVQDLWPESLSATGAVTNPRILSAVSHLVRWIYRGCEIVLVQSRAFFEPVVSMGVPREKVAYFPNSAEPLYKPATISDNWSGPELPTGFRVMFAGNLGEAQSLGTLLGAAELLKHNPQIQWIIVGDGRKRSWVADEIVRRGLQDCVHLVGRHPVETMPQWFSRADVMLASLSREPIFALTIPAKVQSYLACARPIIAAIDGEGARIVEEAQAGVSVPAEDSVALASAVESMAARTPEELRVMGENGLRYFNMHFQRDLLLDKFEEMLARAKGVSE